MKFGNVHNIHLVGIGGIGMSGIAEVLVNLGYQVSGSDLRESAITAHLEQLGVKIAIGHDANHIKHTQVIVASSAIQNDNPEVLAAINAKIPVITRGEMLAELMRMKYGIAVAGSHGKTTTTSMIAQVLSNSNMNPTIIIGGKLGSIGSNAKLGKGPLLVAEADESDGSFLLLSPTIGVITNVDFEHVDYYRNLDEIMNAFVNFGNKIPFYGSIFICIDDPNLSSLLPKFKRRVQTYGTNPKANIQATDIQIKGWNTSFKVRAYDKDLGQFSLGVAGHHMVLNALATIGVAIELGIDCNIIRTSLANFTGAERRFQKRGEYNDILIIDDYGHHPTEIIATLKAAKCSFPDKRIIVAFQPHRYSRVKALIKEFGQAFQYADKVIITDIYAAGESPIPSISGQSIVSEILNNCQNDVTYLPNIEDLVKTLKNIAKPGDLVITMGAGSITKIGPLLLQSISQKS